MDFFPETMDSYLEKRVENSTLFPYDIGSLGKVIFNEENTMDGYEEMNIAGDKICYIDSKTKGPSLVFIHGNSCSLQVFTEQYKKFKNKYRVILVDLPGHGKSGDAKSPKETYSMKGYAKVLDLLIKSLHIDSFVVVGYSMGGNIALQWSLLNQKIKGIAIICSAPIIHSEAAMEGYPSYEDNFSAHPEKLSEKEASAYMRAVGFDDKKSFFSQVVKDAVRCDGASRKYMVEGVLAGTGANERVIVEQMETPLMVMEGELDVAVDLDYVKGLKYGALWQGKVMVLDKGFHSLIFQQSREVNSYLSEFLESI